MPDTLLKTVTNLGSPKIMVVGDFMLDVAVFGNAVKISPHAPIPVLRVVRREYNAGGAGFVATDINALGGEPLCIGVIGSDRNGDVLAELLENAGADISGLLKLSDRPTITKQRLVGLAQHKHPQELIRFDDESDGPLSKAQRKDILELFRAKLPLVDVVCLQDYNKGLLSPEICREMIDIACSAGKKVLVDPWPMSDYTKYTNATLITPNRNEASLASDIEVDSADAAGAAAKVLCENLHLDASIITLDSEGLYLKTDSIDQLIPTVPRTVYDVSGAGDMILAAFAVTIAGGCDYYTAAQIANLAAGIQVEKFGAANVTIDEIVNEILSRTKGSEGKIFTREMVEQRLNWHRSRGRKIVFTNGCFDVLHTGHISYLKFCKQQGDIVVVGLNSDTSVKEIKGPERPVNNQHDRAAVLAALQCVDYVVTFAEPDPLELIKVVKPDVLIKGQDWEHKGVIGREFVQGRGGAVVLAPMVEGKSSTATIEKLKELEKADKT